MWRVFFILSLAFLQNLQALELEKAIELALKNSYQLESREHLVESSKLARAANHTLFMPSVTFGYTYNYRAPANRAAFSSNTLNITGQMNLFNGMQDFYTYKKSGVNVAINENNLEQNKNDIVLNTKLTYIKILQNKQALKIANESIKLLESQLKQATQFYIHGISDKSAALSVEVNLANAKSS